MHKAVLHFFFFIIFFTASTAAYAIGGGPSYHRVAYSQGFEGTFSHRVFNQNGGMGTIEVSGELAPYLSAIPDTIDLSSPKEITYTVKLPDAPLDYYGMQYASIRVFEEVEDTGGIIARTAIHFMFQMLFPYPGLYAEMAFETQNINEGDTILPKATITSRGNQTIANGVLRIWIEDNTGKTILTDQKDGITLSTNDKEIHTPKFSSDGLAPGVYVSKALFRYGEETLEREHSFTIGSYYVDIRNHTDTITTGTINKFEVTAKSEWKGTLENVYAVLTMNGRDYTSPTVRLGDFHQQTLEIYVDATQFAAGNTPARITVFFEDQRIFKDVTIRVMDPPAPVSDPDEEQPKSWTITLNTTTILILLVIALIVINAIFLLKPKKKK